jgi:hypothetical protein
MSLYKPLLALANNDNTFKMSVTLNGAILPLTNYTPKAYQKAQASSLDSSGTLYQVGSGLTIVNSALGQINLTIPHGNVTTPGTQWWHLDLVDGSGNVSTVFYGPLTIKAV